MGWNELEADALLSIQELRLHEQRERARAESERLKREVQKKDDVAKAIARGYDQAEDLELEAALLAVGEKWEAHSSVFSSADNFGNVFFTLVSDHTPRVESAKTTPPSLKLRYFQPQLIAEVSRLSQKLVLTDIGVIDTKRAQAEWDELPGSAHPLSKLLRDLIIWDRFEISYDNHNLYLSNDRLSNRKDMNRVLYGLVKEREELMSLPADLSRFHEAIIDRFPDTLRATGSLDGLQLRDWAHHQRGSSRIYRATDTALNRLGLSLPL